MFRRSRFSLRPNVGSAGRAAATTTQEAPSSNQVAGETPSDISDGSIPTAVTDTSSVVAPSEKNIGPGDGNDQNVEGTGSKAAVQRRKRFSVKPKVAPGRPSTVGRTPKSPVKEVSAAPVGFPESDLDKTKTPNQTKTTAAPQGLQSPKGRRPSEEGEKPKVQPKLSSVSSDHSVQSVALLSEQSLGQTNLLTDTTAQPESKSASPVKDVPPKPAEKVSFSLPDAEAVEIAEKAKTLVSSKSGPSLSPSAMSLSRLLNDPSDLQRLAKAQKLRELLKQERHKEKKFKKTRSRIKEFTIDPAKMTMGDLIRYLPLSNPMTSSLEEQSLENEIVVPPSPVRQPCPEKAQEPEVLPKIATPTEEEQEEEGGEEEQEQEQDEDVMVPQVKVAEDGSLIIDEESLTVEVQRAKGPNPAHGRDAIFERGSTTTYSSFRKGTYSKPWSSEETDMFYLAVSMVGTDFTMICQLFPHRTRSEIKNKFKKEERENAWRIDKAFKERRQLDIEYFSKLLEKILEFQKNRKKLKSLTKKITPKKCKKKAKGKKASMKLSDVEEGEEEDAFEVPDSEDEDEEEGEKENEELCNEDGTSESKPKRRFKRKTEQADLKEEPNDKKKKSHEQDEACIPEDTEATLPEEHTSAHMSEQTENVDPTKDSPIKPAKLSRGRAPKPLLPLGRKYGKKPPPPAGNSNDTTFHNEEDSVCPATSKEKVDEDSSPLKQANMSKSADDDIFSEEEDATVQPPRPTRYGRVPKPTQPLNYPAQEEPNTHASDATPASPVGSAASASQTKPKCTVKRARSTKQQSAQESKKPKLVTLRASRSDYSDEDDDTQQGLVEIEEEEHPACSPGDEGLAPVFVPASLRSPHPVISEVEETMEELDILASMPNVLDISQDAMCPDASCERAQKESGTAEPCEHQLDLLVDVIDFLSSEHTEVCEDESYNEAAQTLLTIGNLTHLPQSSDNQLTTQSCTTGKDSVAVKQTGQNLDETAAQEESRCSPLLFDQEQADKSGTSATVEQRGTTDNCDIPVIKSEEKCHAQKSVSDMDASPLRHSSPRSSKNLSPHIRKGCSSKVKPKPNLGRGSRSAQPKSQPGTTTEKTAEESNGQVTGTLSAPEESTMKVPEYSQTSSIDYTSSTNEKLEGKRTVSQVESGGERLDPSSPENQGNLEPSSGELVNKDTRSPSVSSEDTPVPHAEIILSNNLTPDITESQVAKRSSTGSVSVRQVSPDPADLVAPVDDAAACQKEEGEVASTCRSGRSRLQKAKPNLTRTSRTAWSVPQYAKDSAETHISPTPTQIHVKTMVEVKQTGDCGAATEKPSHSTGAQFNLGSPLLPTKQLPSTEEKKTNGGPHSPLDPISATLAQSASGKQNLFEAIFQPDKRDATSGSTDGNGSTHCAKSELSAKLVTCDSAVSDSLIGQDAAPGEESSEHPAPGGASVEDSTVSQKAQREAAVTSRKSRLQKVKPKPNIQHTPRTTHSIPQTSTDSGEKDCSEKTPPIRDTPSEKQSQNTGPLLVLVPSLDLGSALSSPKELPATEDKRTCDGLVGQVDSIASTSGQSVSQNQGLSENTFKMGDTDAALTSGSTDEQGSTHDGIAEGNDNLLTCDSVATVSHIGQETVPGQESGEHPATGVTSAEDLPASQKVTSKVTSAGLVKRSRLQRVKPKPNLAQTSRTALSKPQTTKDPAVHVPLDDGPASSNSKSGSTDGTVAEVEDQPICSVALPVQPSQSTDIPSASLASLESCKTHPPTEESSAFVEQKSINISSNRSEPNIPQRRQQFPKIKPNLGPSARPTQTNADCKLDMSTEFAESNTHSPKDPTAAPATQSSEEPTVSSLLASNVHSITDPQDISRQPCSTSDSEVKSQEAPLQTCSQTRETDQASNDGSQSSQSTEGTALTDSPKSSKKAPQTRRGRLFRPKPNLGHSSRPPQPQQVQKPKQENADSGVQSKGADALVSHNPVSEPQPAIQESVAAIEPRRSQESLSENAGSLLGCVTQTIDQLPQQDSCQKDPVCSVGCVTQIRGNSSQKTSTLPTEGSQSHPSLPKCPDLTSEPSPSDPEEPFFILSLTEIPVVTSGEMVVSAAERPAHGTDESSQQRSIPGETLAAAAGGSLFNVPVSIVTEESVKDAGPDPAAYKDVITEDPVDPQERTIAQPSTFPETSEIKIETPPTKQRLGSGRRAKHQVKPNITVSAKKKNASKAFASATSRESDLAGPSAQPDAADIMTIAGSDAVTEAHTGSGDHVTVEKRTPAGGSGPEDGSAAPQTQTTTTRRTSVRNRIAPSSDPSPCAASSKRSEVQTTHPRKCSSRAQVVSASLSVSPTASPAQQPEEARSVVDIQQPTGHSPLSSDPNPGTFWRTAAEVSAPEQTDREEGSSVEEEPTNVSQYFLSDIFTEVEEG